MHNLMLNTMNAPDSASPGLVAICGGGRALDAACADGALICPVAEVRCSYSGSSASIVSNKGVDELMVAEETS